MIIMSLKMLVSNRSEPRIPYIHVMVSVTENSLSIVNHFEGIWG